MQLVRFMDLHDTVSCGVRISDSVIHHIRGDMFGEIEKLNMAAPASKLLAPVAPPNIIAIGANYAAHAKEAGKKVPDHPLVFVKLTTTVVGPGEPIILPAEAPNEVDYEAELAIVIGKTCRNASEAEALDYVLGYTCGHDVSARDCQMRYDGQWARGKSFDTFCPLGPWIETDLDPSDLRVRLILNGQVMQDGRTSQMLFPPAKLVSYLSRQFTLLPGTVIMTGTPEGVGYFRKPQAFLHDGDEVTVEVEGIGALTNPVRKA
ncbi:MAG: fumarylacetoacetate hydrolase family protein [Phycisphaerae bacterium]|nr:fumarylacetoacetate hydrolase family protein [Phycisphaerae bacterium]